MKKRSLSAIVLILLLVLTSLTLSACSKATTQTASDEGWIVTFNPNDRDQTLQQITVQDGETASAPAQPTRTDYVFTGWYTTKRCAGEPFDFSTPITGDMFLYAGWTTTKVRVIFDFGYDGAESVIATVDGGQAIAAEQIPDVGERENYEFLGWATDARGNALFDLEKTVTKDMTLYAAWQQQKASVTFDLGYFGAADVPADQLLDLTAGEKVAQPADPVRGEDGDYRFEGWYTGSGKKEAHYDFESTVTGDVELHAKWTMLRATVTYDMNCADASTLTEKVDVGGNATQYASATRDGYDFAGWYFDKDCTAAADMAGAVIADDMTVYAAWTAQPRSITYHLNYDGAPEAETIASVYDAETVEPAEPVREGDEFIGWFLDAEQKEAYTFGSKLTSDLVLYAGWNSKAAAAQPSASERVAPNGGYLLIFHVNDGTGSIYKEEEVQKNRYSEMRTSGVTYPTREGYRAFGWYTTPDCQEGTEFNPNTRIRESIDLYVKWIKEYVFEAEMTQLTDIPIGDTGKTEDKLGFGESSNPKGLYLIEWDCYNAGASGDYYVSYLYNPGSYLEFCITAEEVVENATLVLRLTPELHDMYFGTGGPDGTAVEKNGYKVYVNPVYSFNSIINKENLEGYDQVFDLAHDLTGAVTKDEDPNYTRKRAFEDYEITATMNLRQGENIIRLVTDNTHDYGGSMHSAAPMVDCIKIYTNATLTWTEGKCYDENLDGIDARWPAKQQAE